VTSDSTHVDERCFSINAIRERLIRNHIYRRDNIPARPFLKLRGLKGDASP